MPMRVVCARLAVWFAFPLVFSQWAAAGPTEAWQIVPGQSIGPVRLGTSARDLSQSIGSQPDQTHIVGSITYLSYARQGLTVAVRDNQIVLILSTSERHRTEKGLAVGQAASAVAAAYGPPASGVEAHIHWYDAIGLVVVTGGNTIIRIGVFDPKTFHRAILADERPARDVFLTARQPKYGMLAQATSGAGTRTALITITLKNASPGVKVLNPNFILLVDREGKTYKFDPSTFRQSDACRSTVAVKPGETRSCSVVYVIPAAASARSLMFNDGGSIDEFYF